MFQKVMGKGSCNLQKKYKRIKRSMHKLVRFATFLSSGSISCHYNLWEHHQRKTEYHITHWVSRAYAWRGSKKPGRSKALPEPSSSFTFHFPSPNCWIKVPVTPFLARRPVKRTFEPFCRAPTICGTAGLCDFTKLGQPPKGAAAAKLFGTGRRSMVGRSSKAFLSASTCFSQDWADAVTSLSSSLIWPAVCWR